jgi:predicted alpha/beta superfamily hydrolase
MLSDKAIKILADKIAPEVIEELAMSDEFIQFLHEQIPALIDKRLGEMDEDLYFDISMLVMDKIRLTTYD